jgi:molybdenum cofactor cytidylyltransferase
MASSRANNVSGLILAAGLSGRMNAFKPLLDFNGKSFLINVIEKLSAVCRKIVVVTGNNSSKIVNHLDDFLSGEQRCKVETVYNEIYERGMFSSLRIGVQRCEGADWIIYHFADQPSIPKKFYAEFAGQTASGFDWIQPMNKGRKGHPILLGKKAADAIVNADDNTNLRDLSGKFLKKYWTCSYSEIFEDIDYPDDYSLLLSNKK